MVLPVLGLLGLGATALAKPRYDTWSAGIRGDYGTEAMEGVDQNDPNATRNALFGAGLLDADRFQADSRTQFEGMAQRAQSDANSRRAAGTAANRLAFDRERVMFERNQAQEQAEQRRLYSESLIMQNGTPAHVRAIANPYTPDDVINTIGNQVLDSMTQAPYDPANDPAVMAQDYLADQQFERDQVTQELADDAALAERQFEAEEQYIGEAQDIINGIDMAQFAESKLVDEASFNSWLLTDVQGSNNTQMLNRIIGAQRMDYFRNVMGRTDAPNESDIPILDQLFPYAEAGLEDEKKRAIIRQNLKAYITSQSNQLEQRQGVLTRQGFAVPGLKPQEQLPDNWQIDRSGDNG